MVLIRDGRNKSPTTEKRKLLIIAFLGLLFIVVSGILWLMDPIALISQHRTRIAKGSLILEMLRQELPGVTVSTYLFNVTNAERFVKGADRKLKVEEIGPFAYKEYRNNEDLELDEDAGILRYTPRVRTEFLPEESVADPATVSVVMPNIALLSMSSMMATYPYWTRIAYTLLIKRLASAPVVTLNAHDYLWGYDEPLIKFANTIMPGWVDFEELGLLDRLYDKKARFRMEVGSSNADKLNVKRVNGVAGFKAWGYKDGDSQRCNSYVDAYEGLAYPINMTPDSRVRIYRNVLCRNLELDYVETRTMDYGPDALVYQISNRTFSINQDTDCLCGRGTCVDGISDISPCFYGLPLAISAAHFTGADPSLYEHIDGMKPDSRRHGSEFIIERKMGGVLKTSFSVQVNVVVRDVGFCSEAKPFSNMVVPVAYFNITAAELTEDQKSQYYLMYITAPYVLLGMVATLALIGLSLLIYAARLFYWSWIYSDGKGIAFQLPEDWKDIKPNIIDTPLGDI